MILHFSHIGLTDGRTFMIPFELNDPDGEALEAGTAAATPPRSCKVQSAKQQSRFERDQGA